MFNVWAKVDNPFQLTIAPALESLNSGTDHP